MRRSERLVPNSDIINARAGKAAAVSRPGANCERDAGIIVQRGADGCCLGSTVQIEGASAGRKRDRDVMPGGANNSGAGDERWSGTAGLAPDYAGHRRIGGIQRENVIGKETVGLAREHRPEGAAAIGILRARPFDPHTNGAGVRGIEAAAAGHTEILRAAEGERATGHAVPVGRSGNRSNKRTVYSASSCSISIKRPIREESGRVFAYWFDSNQRLTIVPMSDQFGSRYYRRWAVEIASEAALERENTL